MILVLWNASNGFYDSLCTEFFRHHSLHIVIQVRALSHVHGTTLRFWWYLYRLTVYKRTWILVYLQFACWCLAHSLNIKFFCIRVRLHSTADHTALSPKLFRLSNTFLYVLSIEWYVCEALGHLQFLSTGTVAMPANKDTTMEWAWVRYAAPTLCVWYS